jgi:TonB family protein
MRVVLCGRWPPLKPLPLFKCEADEYRASIEFDKLRGEWVCRKTSLSSNKVQEMRGGLADIARELPPAPPQAFAEPAAGEQPEEELPKDAIRRRQAMQHWRETCENGALYSGLRNYLSEGQQNEIEDSLRLTLTARQLQSNAKNIAYVFDALSKAGGKLATLIEIAYRNKTAGQLAAPGEATAGASDAEILVPAGLLQGTRERRRQMRKTLATHPYVNLGDNNGGLALDISETGMAIQGARSLKTDELFPRICFQLPNAGPNIEVSARIVWLAEPSQAAGLRFVDLSAEGRGEIANWIASEAPSPEFAKSTWTPVEVVRPAAVEDLPEEIIENLFPDEERPSPAEPLARIASPASSRIAAPQMRSPKPVRYVETFNEKLRQRAPVARMGGEVRGGHDEAQADTDAGADAMENSPLRTGAFEISGFQIAAMLVFALLSLVAGLTVGRGQLGKRLQVLQKSTTAVDASKPALGDRLSETNSRTANAPAADTFPASDTNSPAPPSLDTRGDSALVGSVGGGPAGGPPDGLISRSASPPANSQPSHSAEAAAPLSGGPSKSVARALAPRVALRPSSPSTMLVSGPGDGSKPFRLTLPEKAIAASSSFAMTSQLSVLIAPEIGALPAHRLARLQAGELVSFVWPHYPRPGDRHGSSETVNVRIAVGELGQVLDVNRLSGSVALFPAAMSAIRLWRYRPTLVNNRPVEAQQDVTIEFRPPQYLSHGSARHASHKGK